MKDTEELRKLREVARERFPELAKLRELQRSGCSGGGEELATQVVLALGEFLDGLQVSAVMIDFALVQCLATSSDMQGWDRAAFFDSLRESFMHVQSANCGVCAACKARAARESEQLS